MSYYRFGFLYLDKSVNSKNVYLFMNEEFGEILVSKLSKIDRSYLSVKKRRHKNERISSHSQGFISVKYNN